MPAAKSKVKPRQPRQPRASMTKRSRKRRRGTVKSKREIELLKRIEQLKSRNGLSPMLQIEQDVELAELEAEILGEVQVGARGAGFLCGVWSIVCACACACACACGILPDMFLAS